MKGFLHHLVTTVIRPQTNVHPFSESIYHAQPPKPSGPHRSPIPTALPEQDSVIATHPATAVARTSPPPAASPIESQAEFAPRSPFQPLLPQYQLEDTQATNPFAQPPDADIPPRSSSKLQLVPAEGDQPADGMERVVASRAAQSESVTKPIPLVPAVIQNQFIAAQMKSVRPAQAPPRSYSDAPHSDDIRIHIGRVEVIAVQQPEVRRTPPPPVRKGLSLDEYLSRRNGRNG